MKLLPPFIYTLTSSALTLNRFQTPKQQSQQHILSPPSLSFLSLGDSYSAGIGTGTPPPPSESTKETPSSCRRGTGAYPYLIHTDLHLSPPSSQWQWQWLSCTGSTTTDLLALDSGQIDSINTSLPTAKFATLSIGGNDVGFFDVINACVFRFYAFYSGGCEGVLGEREGVVRDALALGEGEVERGGGRLEGGGGETKKEAVLLVQRLRLVLLEMLDKIRWEVNGEFVILVTGYAEFFNDQTEACDDVSLAVWWDGILDDPPFGGGGNGTTVYRPKLTREVRGRMNRLVRGVNKLLGKIVEGVNKRFGGRKRVLFVDYDDLFEGHRFCEEGIEEPDYERGETWFFLPGGLDSPAGEEGLGKEMLLGGEDRQLVDPVGCLEAVERSGDWGERALCYMALAKERHPELVLSPRLVPSVKIMNKDSMWYVPTYYGKTFHPRSLGHQVIRDRLYEVWEQDIGLEG